MFWENRRLNLFNETAAIIVSLRYLPIQWFFSYPYGTIIVSFIIYRKAPMRLQATNHYRSANLRLWQAILGEPVDQGIEMHWSVSKKRKNDTVQARAGHE